MPLIGAMLMIVVFGVTVALGAAFNFAFLGGIPVLPVVAVVFVIASLGKIPDARMMCADNRPGGRQPENDEMALTSAERGVPLGFLTAMPTTDILKSMNRA